MTRDRTAPGAYRAHAKRQKREADVVACTAGSTSRARGRATFVFSNRLIDSGHIPAPLRLRSGSITSRKSPFGIRVLKRIRSDSVRSTSYVPLREVMALVPVMNEAIKLYLRPKTLCTAGRQDAMHMDQELQIQLALWVGAY